MNTIILSKYPDGRLKARLTAETKKADVRVMEQCKKIFNKSKHDYIQFNLCKAGLSIVSQITS